MEFISSKDVTILSNPGVESFQLLSPHNSDSKRVTITKVVVQPQHSQDRHSHSQAEQIWIALEGSAQLLLANDFSRDFNKGDIVRFKEGETHGLLNSSERVFQYLAITAPPQDFEEVYDQKRIHVR